MSNSTLTRKKDKSGSDGEFEKYLNSKRSKTTYNGIELETEGWQKEIFGEQKK